MNNLDITNIGTYIRDNSDTIYRLWKYKKMFTPYELDGKFKDESVFEDDICTLVRIVNAIEIPNDVLLKCRVVSSDCIYEDSTYTDGGLYIFERLSNIMLAEYDYDNKR